MKKDIYYYCSSKCEQRLLIDMPSKWRIVFSTNCYTIVLSNVNSFLKLVKNNLSAVLHV